MSRVNLGPFQAAELTLPALNDLLTRLANQVARLFVPALMTVVPQEGFTLGPSGLTVTVALPGAQPGDIALAALVLPTAVSVTAFVPSVNLVTVNFANVGSGSAVVEPGPLRVVVFPL